VHRDSRWGVVHCGDVCRFGGSWCAVAGRLRCSVVGLLVVGGLGGAVKRRVRGCPGDRGQVLEERLSGRVSHQTRWMMQSHEICPSVSGQIGRPSAVSIMECAWGPVASVWPSVIT
jgi:hypothetical protein